MPQCLVRPLQLIQAEMTAEAIPVCPVIILGSARELGELRIPIIQEASVPAATQDPDNFGERECWIHRGFPGSNPALAGIVNDEDRSEDLARHSGSTRLLVNSLGILESRGGLQPDFVGGCTFEQVHLLTRQDGIMSRLPETEPNQRMAAKRLPGKKLDGQVTDRFGKLLTIPRWPRFTTAQKRPAP